MNRRTTAGILALLLTGALWMVHSPARSQDIGGESGIPAIGSPSPPSRVHPAALGDRLLWAGISLINPDSKKKPVFLYSYELSKLNPNVRVWLCSEAAAGRLDIAILKHAPMGDGQYEGQIVQVPSNMPNSPDADDFCEDYENSGDRRVALSRPLQERLRGDAPEQEFVAKPGFWSPDAPDR